MDCHKHPSTFICARNKRTSTQINHMPRGPSLQSISISASLLVNIQNSCPSTIGVIKPTLSEPETEGPRRRGEKRDRSRVEQRGGEKVRGTRDFPVTRSARPDALHIRFRVDADVDERRRSPSSSPGLADRGSSRSYLRAAKYYENRARDGEWGGERGCAHWVHVTVRVPQNRVTKL